MKKEFAMMRMKNGKMMQYFAILLLFDDLHSAQISISSTHPIKSKSEKINVLFTSNPKAIISMALARAIFIVCSILISFHKVFSSSVN